MLFTSENDMCNVTLNCCALMLTLSLSKAFLKYSKLPMTLIRNRLWFYIRLINCSPFCMLLVSLIHRDACSTFFISLYYPICIPYAYHSYGHISINRIHPILKTSFATPNKYCQKNVDLKIYREWSFFNRDCNCPICHIIRHVFACFYYPSFLIKERPLVFALVFLNLVIF